MTAVLLAPVAVAVAGCAAGGGAGDVQFPDFVYRSADALDGYKIAVSSRDILRQMPCYCGCVQNPDRYQNLEDCFYDRSTGDFDEHAAGCQTCLEEAKDISQWRDDGLSTAAIRSQLDAKYAGRGDPTHTPPVTQ